ncbi:MAG TPA: GIY-YIG nuclease family protein [Candidatus Hydrogenedentes bacterium]|nr:GIY-YIG nuclease family protein [Candidatus Hydrogenedentota bacterium]
MNLNDLLERRGVDPRDVLVLRHRPIEPKLRRILPWLAAEKHNVFNTYQQTQTKNLERTMLKLVGPGYVAAFIGMEPGKAVFVGLYSITGSKPLSQEQFWKIAEHRELKTLGLGEWNKSRKSVLLFDLVPQDFYAQWKGKLTIIWPPPERSWWRRAHRNDMQVHSILEESAFATTMPNWDEIALSWEELAVFPTHWRSVISQWRGIYYIFDTSDGKGYVGSAYGEDNLFGRWCNYAASGHGGNKLLKKRDPKNFVFTILQRVSPDMDAHDVIHVENTWKQRLHTRAPDGLNDN